MQLEQTPKAPCQWFKGLGEPEPNRFEPKSPPFWSTDLILNLNIKAHKEWFDTQEGEVSRQHGVNAKASTNALPFKTQDDGTVIWTFKLKRFTRKIDGGFTPGPLVVDSKNNAWDPSNLIGNGSEIRIGYDLYPWKGPQGVGLAYQMRQVQVIDYVAYERASSPVFDEVQGGYVSPSDVVFNAEG